MQTLSEFLYLVSHSVPIILFHFCALSLSICCICRNINILISYVLIYTTNHIIKFSCSNLRITKKTDFSPLQQELTFLYKSACFQVTELAHWYAHIKSAPIAKIVISLLGTIVQIMQDTAYVIWISNQFRL